jgi:hypothetical protein
MNERVCERPREITASRERTVQSHNHQHPTRRANTQSFCWQSVEVDIELPARSATTDLDNCAQRRPVATAAILTAYVVPFHIRRSPVYVLNQVTIDYLINESTADHILLFSHVFINSYHRPPKSPPLTFLRGVSCPIALLYRRLLTQTPPLSRKRRHSTPDSGKAKTFDTCGVPAFIKQPPVDRTMWAEDNPHHFVTRVEPMKRPELPRHPPVWWYVDIPTILGQALYSSTTERLNRASIFDRARLLFLSVRT